MRQILQIALVLAIASPLPVTAQTSQDGLRPQQTIRLRAASAPIVGNFPSIGSPQSRLSTFTEMARSKAQESSDFGATFGTTVGALAGGVIGVVLADSYGCTMFTCDGVRERLSPVSIGNTAWLLANGVLGAMIGGTAGMLVGNLLSGQPLIRVGL
jgi:hypothetical protein